MNRLLCKYSIIRFQPFVETEEFANVGIVLYVPETRILHFKLLPAKEHKRLTQFFKPLNKEIYTNTVHIISAELERIQRLLTASVLNKMDVYDDLIRPREDIVQYSKNRVLFSADVEKTVDELFEHYVKRDFAYREPHEEEMRKRIRLLLKEHGLEEQFKDGYVGKEDQYEVHLPFVDSKCQTAIKPIHFRHPDSSKLIEHGLQWMMKVTQLKRFGLIDPQNILFTYNPPEDRQGALFNAFVDVKKQIEDVGISTVNIDESDVIADFARSHL